MTFQKQLGISIIPSDELIFFRAVDIPQDHPPGPWVEFSNPQHPGNPGKSMNIWYKQCTHRIHVVCYITIYGNMDPINIPQMLAYIHIPYMDPMGYNQCLVGGLKHCLIIYGIILPIDSCNIFQDCSNHQPGYNQCIINV